MDWVERRESITAQIKKLRYVIFIALVGVFLMLLPEEETSAPSPTVTVEAEEPDLQEALEMILHQISGVGTVNVLLTQAEGERIFYQTDDNVSGEDIRRDTVLVSDSARQETGLIVQTLPPVYQGAVIVCQGGDSAAVRLAVVQAVMSVTGLSADRITVLKMK